MSRTFLYNIEIRNEFLETAWRVPEYSPYCKYAISRGQMGCVLELVAFRWTGITDIMHDSAERKRRWNGRRSMFNDHL
jgi:hypothetical protein